MPIANAYNPNPQSVDKLLRERQTQADLAREQGLISEEKPVVENPKFFGVEQTPDSPDKSIGRKIGEDAALLAYAIPVGIAQAVTHPIEFIKQAPGAIVQSVKDTVDPDYYKAHPLLSVVNLAGFVAPIAGAAKTAALKTATRVAINNGTRTAVSLGVKSVVADSIFAGTKAKILNTVVKEAAKTGKTEIIKETVRNLFLKEGVAEDVALRIGTEMADSVYSNFSRQSQKLKVLESVSHPFGTTAKFLTGKSELLRESLFGTPAKTAVAKIYGAETVAKNPEGFLAIERWAEAQLKERGLDSTVSNRQRIMQEWIDQNSQWASLTPEERVAHFKNYAEQDLTRLKIHEATGIDIVTTKALPQNYVDAMVQTIKDAPNDLDAKGLMTLLEDTFGNDFKMHSAEIVAALAKGGAAKEVIEAVVSKLGSARSTISFAKFSPEVQTLAKQLEKTGYRIGHAPKNKIVSFATDIFAGAKKGGSKIAEQDILTTRTALGNWLDRFGFSGRGLVEGAAEYSYRENFTQRALGDFAKKHGTILKAGKVSIPVEKLFEWIEKNRVLFQQSRKELTLPIRTVFDVKEDDLIRAGFSKEVATDIVAISNKALREVPVAITGMGDAVVNYIKTQDKGFGSWLTKWYDPYLKLAYKLRYDWSPFFAAQQWLETRINSAMLIKDIRLIPFSEKFARLGSWTASKLGKRLESTKTYLNEIIAEPPIQEVAAVRDDILGTLQKTMLDYTSSPDLINIQNAAKGGLEFLKDKAQFEQSIRSRNFWYARFGESSVRMATQFNKALANKFGMTLEDALSHTFENGQKIYKNPQIVQMMRELTQAAYHYKEGFLTSPLMKTLNIVWFPLRFQVKTTQLAGQWLGSLSPASRMVVLNNWVHFANWAGTDEGIEWRRTNRNYLYNILAYSTAYEQIGQSIEAVTKGKLFGGNTGLIGGVPFGFLVNIARELAILPEDPDQFDPKTGRRFQKDVPREIPSAATLSVAIEQLLIQIMPGMPFYSLTGGWISGVSPRKYIESLVRQGVGGIAESIEGRDPAKGRQMLERDFKRVPLEYTRLAE